MITHFSNAVIFFSRPLLSNGDRVEKFDSWIASCTETSLLEEYQLTEADVVWFISLKTVVSCDYIFSYRLLVRVFFERRPRISVSLVYWTHKLNFVTYTTTVTSTHHQCLLSISSPTFNSSLIDSLSIYGSRSGASPSLVSVYWKSCTRHNIY